MSVWQTNESRKYLKMHRFSDSCLDKKNLLVADHNSKGLMYHSLVEGSLGETGNGSVVERLREKEESKVAPPADKNGFARKDCVQYQTLLCRKHRNASFSVNMGPMGSGRNDLRD